VIGKKLINPVIAIFILSLLIRLLGSFWGFPGILHNDESNVVRTALGMRFGNLNPHHFDWPSLSFYVNYFVFWVFIKARIQLQLLFGIEFLQSQFPFWWNPEMPFYFLSRALSALFSAGAGILVYTASKMVFKNKKLPIIASIIYSLGYLAIFFSRYGIHDSMFTFFTFLSFIYSLKILQNGKTKDYVLAAIFAGISTSIKYNGFLACALILIAHLYRNKSLKSLFDKKLVISAIISILIFFVGTPYAIIDYDTFLISNNSQGAIWQMTHMGKALNWGYHLFQSTPKNFGYISTIIGYFGLLLILKKGNKSERLVSFAFLTYVFYIGTWGIAREHCSLPIFPFFAILIAFGFNKISEYFNLKIFSQIIIVLILLIEPIKSTYLDTNKRLHTDTRVQSGNWIQQNVPKHENLYINGDQTGYFGGSNPVFDYGDYNILDMQTDNQEEESGHYIFVEPDKNIINKFEKCENFINTNTTGPNISICFNQ